MIAVTTGHLLMEIMVKKCIYERNNKKRRYIPTVITRHVSCVDWKLLRNKIQRWILILILLT